MTENQKRHGSLAPEFALLGFFYKQPSHGYEVHQKLTADLGEVWHVSQSQAYNILKRLETQGYLTSALLEQDRLPARQVFRITGAGKQRFEQWLDTPTGSSVRAIRLEFITRLYFAQQVAPEKIAPMLDRQSAEVNATITRLELSQTELPADKTFNRLSLQLRVRQLYSVLDWIDECRKVLA